MTLLRQYSHASAQTLDMAEALVHQARDREQLGDFAMQFWPKLWIYRGHTHWRFCTTGESNGESFCVELEETKP